MGRGMWPRTSLRSDWRREAQVPPSSTSSLRLPRRSINWDHTPWQDNWFEDNKDMRALQTSIVTINNAFIVSCL
jgi:hypothetical protein